MGVDLRGGQADVPEHFLDAAQVGTGIEQMGGKTVTQDMRRYFPGYAGRF